MSTWTVSVIIPTYNRADLLPRAVASVLSQDYGNLELLVVDDGSTDQTADVVRAIQATDRRVHYRGLQQNRGIGFARDTGLRHASGDYIAWVDSDDVWLPGKLRLQISVLEQHPEIDIVFADSWNINHIKGTKDRLFDQAKAVMQQLNTRCLGRELYIIEEGIERTLFTKCYVILQSTLFRTEVVDKVGGFDATLSGPEDVEFLWRAAALGARYAYLKEPLVERHKDESSITSRSIYPWTERLEALARCRRWCEKSKRWDLLDPIAAAESRAWRNLVWAYGLENRRKEALHACLKALGYDVSVRSVLSGAVALFGPEAIRYARRRMHPYRCDSEE